MSLYLFKGVYVIIINGDIMNRRTDTREIKIGSSLYMGKNYPIVIQSMCNTMTSDVKNTVKQIKKLEKYGCQLVRVSVFDSNDAKAIKEIKQHINIPIVADIHFDYKLAIEAINNGADKIRINPGNIGSIENVKLVVSACKEHNIPIRIGINSGSLEKEFVDKYGISSKAMIESAKKHIKILEDLDFYDIVLSLKSSDPKLCVEVYQLAAKEFTYPLHIGVTEPGPIIPGIIKSTTAINKILELGIGNTIRVSLSDNPVNEIKVAKQILSINNLYQMPTLISCPTCGRTKINLIKYASKIEDYLYTINKPIKVAMMGCIVNGPGEAKEADIGIAGGNKQAVLFKKGQIIKTIKESEIIKTLKQEINNFSF